MIQYGHYVSQQFVAAKADLSQSVTAALRYGSGGGTEVGAGKGGPQAKAAKRRAIETQQLCPACANVGAGKGNRTPLASLEG